MLIPLLLNNVLSTSAFVPPPATPLFVPNENTLKSKLRLSCVPDSAIDTQSIFADAVLNARIRLYRELGVTRINSLLETNFTNFPTTEVEVLRALAASVECAVVRCILLRMLPNTFMDSSGDVDHRWNEEAPTRERGSFDLDEELKRCENEIVEGILALADPNTPNCIEVQTFDGTADCPAPRVGMSLRPGYYRRPSND